MTTDERIIAYLSKCPPAIEGEKGSDQTFAVACRLYNGFALSESELKYYLKVYSEKCQPPWSDKELDHKVSDAANAKHNEPRGHLLNGCRNGEAKSDPNYRREQSGPRIKSDPAIVIENYLRGFRCGEPELLEASPIKPSEDYTRDGVLILEQLFQEGDRINFVTDFTVVERKSDGKRKANPDGCGESVDRDDLILRWMIDGPPSSEAGGWMRINPVNGGIEDINVTRFRVALIEFDRIPLDLQISFLCRIPIPILAILTSGGKSIHAWVDVSADDFEMYQRDVLRLREILTRFGIDRSNKNPSRLSRLVGVRRVIGAEGDPRQRLLYLNPKPENKMICP